MTIELSACLHGFANYTLQDAIRIAAKLGFKAVDVMAVRPQLYPEDYTKEEIKKFSELIRSYGLKVAAVATSDGSPHTSNLTHENERVRRWKIKHLKSCAELASIMDCNILVTDTGYSMMHGTPVEKAWEWAKAGLTEVAKTCNEFGLVIALEAGPGTIVRDSRDTIRIIEEMGLENIRALLDVGHAMVTFCDFWRENGPHPVDAIHDLKGYLVHLHVHDNQGLLDQHLVPGTGVIDFEAIVDALREVGYSGYMALEPNVRDPIKGFKEGKTYLEKFLMR